MNRIITKFRNVFLDHTIEIMTLCLFQSYLCHVELVAFGSSPDGQNQYMQFVNTQVLIKNGAEKISLIFSSSG